MLGSPGAVPRVTGIDNSAQQLKTARRLQDEHDLHFPLIHGNAEDTSLPYAAFDLAVSEYGAAIWADPYRWIPEAARILRPGGELVFLGNGTFWVLTAPETDDQGPAADRLLRPYFGMHRFDWAGQSGVEFHLGYGDWIRLLRASGFEVLDLLEIRAPDELAELRGDGLVDPDWARHWPAADLAGPQDGPLLTFPLMWRFRLSPKLIPSGEEMNSRGSSAAFTPRTRCYVRRGPLGWG